MPVSHALSDLIIRDDRADAATLALASWFSISSYLLQPDFDHTETLFEAESDEFSGVPIRITFTIFIRFPLSFRQW